MNIDNQTDITNNIQNNYLTNEIADNNNIGTNIPHSLPLNSSNYEYVTKGRKTLYNSTHLNLESPKKQNPSRSKRLSLLNKGNKDSNMYNKNIELFKEMFNSNKKLRKKNNEQSKSLNLNYKLLIKRIASQLRKRVKLPTCKIIKVYQPYRELILRIARGIKKTSKKYNNKEINKNNDRDKYEISLILKEENNKSKQKEINLQPKEEDNINYLLSIDDTSQNINFINDFEKFIEINNIEISDTKIPSFKNENNKYLLTNLFFWIKFIKYICHKFKNNLSFFNFMNFVEVFYNWIDMDKYDLNIFNKLIIEQMELAFDKVAINNFLLIHKLKSIDELFLRYKIMNNFKEAKKRENCQCPSCQNIKQQVINYNKKNTFISYSEENNFNYVNKVIKFPETKTIFDDKYIGLSIDNLNNNNNDNEFKNNIIPEFFRWSREIKQPKNIIPEKILQYNDDKKITDFFVYTKIQRSAKKKKEKKEDEKSANKSIKKSENKSSSKKKKKNKSISNEKKRKKSGIKNNKKGKKRSHYSTKEIFELINMEE